MSTMKIGVLTSSRADYSIYFPLLKKIQADPFFSLSLIVFGTHLSERHGRTIDQIVADGFSIDAELNTYPRDDSPEAIVESMGRTIITFTSIWARNKFDLVFCLGDRYEMFAACSSSVPYLVPLAHLHGGEETIGAIDNTFRHSITHMASFHFTAAESYRNRVAAMLGDSSRVYNVGALSIDNLVSLKLYEISEFRNRYGIDLNKPTILVTIHPETVAFDQVDDHMHEIISSMREIRGFQFVITMPNADTMGNLVRRRWEEFISESDNAFGIESLGTIGYLSCMKHCKMMLGNTSSGYIEASFFPKLVIDIGVRQTGRMLTPNIHKCPIRKVDILELVSRLEGTEPLRSDSNPYGQGNAADAIIKIIKK